jgi:DNA-3-methyladenine glycosylase
MEKSTQIRAKHPTNGRLPGRQLSREFFEHSPDLVAPRLLGMLLVHRIDGESLAGRIVEAEAYLGPHSTPPDPAAHSHRGPTPRNVVLFGPAGHAYVYAIYGRYFCMNISCEVDGLAGCVLLRAVEPVLGIDRMAANRGLDGDVPARLIASGPSRLCLALGLTRPSHNGLDVTKSSSPLQVRDDGRSYSESEVLVTPRIGINPKNEALHWPLRYAVSDHPCVSGPAKLRRALS